MNTETQSIGRAFENRAKMENAQGMTVANVVLHDNTISREPNYVSMAEPSEHKVNTAGDFPLSSGAASYLLVDFLRLARSD
jgi:hypothetical protein